MRDLADKWHFWSSVHRTLRHLPADGDLRGLLESLSAARGRPIVVIPKDGQGRPSSGRWYKTQTADYIMVNTAIAPSSEAITICHEIGHIILDHADDANGLAGQVAPDVAPEVAGRILAMRTRDSYHAYAEQEAERFGTVLAAEARRRQVVARCSADPASQRLR